MSYGTKSQHFGQPKYIPYSREEREEYPPIKTDVSSLSMAELSQINVKMDRPLKLDEKVLKSVSSE
jgi:hypothetical protein